MQKKCDEIIESIEKNKSDHVKVAHNQNTTQKYEYCTTLHDEDYTLGNPLVHYMYEEQYNNDFKVDITHITTDVNENDTLPTPSDKSIVSGNSDKENDDTTVTQYTMKMTFIGFKVPHPHIPAGIVRIIYENANDEEIPENHKDFIIRKLDDHTKKILCRGTKEVKKQFSTLLLKF